MLRYNAIINDDNYRFDYVVFVNIDCQVIVVLANRFIFVTISSFYYGSWCLFFRQQFKILKLNISFAHIFYNIKDPAL